MKKISVSVDVNCQVSFDSSLVSWKGKHFIIPNEWFVNDMDFEDAKNFNQEMI